MKNKRITAKEAAGIIGVSYYTLLNWSSSGRYGNDLPFNRTPSGRLYLMSKDVAKFAKKYAI